MSLVATSKRYFFDKDLFRKIYLALCILFFMPATLDIERYPLFVCMVWGGIIIAKDFFTDREMFKSSYWYLLLMAIVAYLLSTIINYDHALIRGIYNLIFMMINFFIVYPISQKQDRLTVKKNLTTFNDILIIMVFIAGVISLVMFIFHVSYIQTIGANDARQGFIESRLFGVYSSPNVGSIFGMLSVMASLLNNSIKRTRWHNFSKFYIINLIVQYLYFTLSSSRGTMLSLFVISFFIATLIVVPVLSEKLKSIWKATMLTLLMYGVVMVIATFSTTLLRENLGYVPSFVQNIESQFSKEDTISGKEDKEVTPVHKIAIKHSSEGAEASSGRFTIWTAGINVFKQNPLLGITDPEVYREGRDVSAFLDESKLSEMDIKELKRSGGNMHNVYVQTIVNSGIIGFAIIAVFVLLTLKDNTQYLLSFKKPTIDYQFFALIFCLLLGLFAEDFVESHILYNNRDVVGIVFWYYIGVFQYVKKDKFQSQEIS
ncbi:O-antigen ligase family protein [Desemzia sp. FAM 24101]|uniref:O-antigen ligase family protein n=1 Tax=unclassified Desemzia TaxID=2685243 RepID=UPI003887307A